MKRRLAIIGTGIAGLGCAYLLRNRYDLTVYEKNSYPGGHTNTISVREGENEVPIDTGFMVFNKVTYPNLTRFFEELGVAIKPSPMSFSVQHVPTGLEYCGSSLSHLFAQKRNLLRMNFWKMLGQINRFNIDALQTIREVPVCDLTIGEYVEKKRYGSDFLNLYLIPMSSAVWSTPPAQMVEFPAITLLRFFHNHGFLGLNTQHPWFTVQGGSREYVKKILGRLPVKPEMDRGAVAVQRVSTGVEVTDNLGKIERFDEVVMASHADQSLALLKEPQPREQSLLGAFKYQPNVATVHTDASVMPKNKKCWASWNQRIDRDSEGNISPSTIYWMNSLQSVSDRQNYFISINGENGIRPETVLKRINYEHPLFDRNAIQAQERLVELNERSTKVFFCGSYFKYGFHEDAFSSAVQLCQRLTGEKWP